MFLNTFFKKGSRVNEVAAMSDREGSLLVTGLQQAFRDDFNGATINPDNWAVSIGAGMTCATNGSGGLVINAGTTANAETKLTGLVPFTVPMRAWFIFNVSQRIANSTIYLEVVNAAGTMMAQWVLDGTVSTAGYPRCVNGGNANNLTAQTINTTVGDTILEINMYPDEAQFFSRSVDSASGKVGSFVLTRNVPDPNETYFLRARIVNGSTAPASAVIMTIAAICAQDINEIPVEITGGQGDSAAFKSMAVTLAGGSASASVSGTAAHDAAVSGNPVRLAGRALSAAYTTVATGDTADLITTLQGVQIVRPWQIPELEWSYAAAAGGVVNTTDVAVKTAAAAGLRNYITGMQLKNTNATATEVVLKDGATVIWRGHLSASMTGFENVVFANPLKTTAATALNFACVTTGAQVYVNCQGYVAP